MPLTTIESARQALAPVSRQAATEGIVLLKNTDNTLPLPSMSRVSLFGRCQIDTVRSGTGSGGAVNVPYSVNALEGLSAHPCIQVNMDLVSIYQTWLEQHPFDDGGGGWAAEPWYQEEMPLSSEVVSQARKQSDYAIVFIGRTAGEDQDNADESGSYRLTETEYDMLHKVCAQFDKVIVVLNVTNIIDMSWVDSMENADSIKAILYSWAAGMEGGHALADVLSGDVSPSGKLADTIAKQLVDYPSHANFGNSDQNLYCEDIYLGYRYFSTFKPDAVRYAFGEGLSYTSFTRKFVSSSIEGSGKNRAIHFHVEVTNVGDTHRGKEVVQIYVEAPQGKLGKPARVLAGFGKSKTLAPNESELMRIIVPVSALASYDDSGCTGYKSCYVLEAGRYHFHVGGSVREATLIDASFDVDTLQVIEQLSESAAPVTPFQRIKPAATSNALPYAIEHESVPTRSICMETRISERLPVDIEITGDTGIKLKDVASGSASMSSFVAQFTPAMLATIVRGEGMCSPKVTPGTAAAFGGVSDALFDLGIPVAAAADGPSGIRMDSGHKATQVPIGTLLGCTWNTELNEHLFYLVGGELQSYNIDTLLGPGINIHRHPLNGRNFEYFSEDPLLTGSIAAAQVGGLKKAGVSGTIKHFASNDQETSRFDVDSVMSERALREVHIKPFELAVKHGGATTIMTSYNPINGHWGASNYDLNTSILRGEWGFDGIVMSDWWAKMNHPVHGGDEAKTYTSYMVRAQNDLYMVVDNDGAERNAMKDDTLAALESGTLTLGELQRSAMNICRFLINTPAMQRPIERYNPVKPFTAKQQAPEEPSHTIEQPVKLATSSDTSVVINVEKAAKYLVSIQVSYDRNELAQSSCSLSFNGEYSMSLSTNGTDGAITDIDGLIVDLETGWYDVGVAFVKPGLTLHHIAFSEIK
ncbi:glycoside hydrolase family 3 protein [Vibrio sp. SCSIO 43140]|uniref:glycoside hydrolase family 3 protein n=1 Tax=Vibrio sp. SCSIO 43140 TaxID=2819100 RepID=UPI0020756A62|nr:glycoside hydrolase family 3 protein [Vibrio sp. SCSIO 43140]USD62581.1 glycoside hydrolase family 3 protein [Vibrio sp. SCSIO 43140]